MFYTGSYEAVDPDQLVLYDEKQIGLDGMRIDRMFFQKFEEKVTADQSLRQLVEDEQWDRVVDYVRNNIMDKPEEFYSEARLRKAAGGDRRVPLREMIEKAFGLVPRFKSKDELLEEEFAKFLAVAPPGEYAEAATAHIPQMKYFFKAYISDPRVRAMIDEKRFAELNTNPAFTMQDYKDVPPAYRTRIPDYVKDYVQLNQFML